jgi:signal transduction histidine kinase
MVKKMIKHDELEQTIKIIRHDLINPIGAIRMTSDVLLLDKFDKKTKSNLQAIRDSCDQEIELIRNISTYFRLFINPLVKTQIDLDKTFKKVIIDLKPKIDEKKIKVRYLAKKAIKVRADPQIELIFSNFLSNAIKYSSFAGKIEVNILRENNKIKIYVKDNGIGVKPDYKEQIFNRFMDENKKGIQGSGIGLAIVKKIAQMHHGRVWVEDNLPIGSIFNFEFPLA